MKKHILLSLLVIVSTAFVVDAQVKQGKTRLLRTKQMMKGLIGANCGALGESLKTPPTTDEAWADLEMKAALLNESSYLLMDDGRCPDADWANAAKSLGEGSAKLVERLAAKDAPGAQEAFKAMTQSCGACHKVHKK